MSDAGGKDEGAGWGDPDVGSSPSAGNLQRRRGRKSRREISEEAVIPGGHDVLSVGRSNGDPILG